MYMYVHIFTIVASTYSTYNYILVAIYTVTCIRNNETSTSGIVEC